MASIQIKASISIDELLQAVEQLSFSDLEQLAELRNQSVDELSVSLEFRCPDNYTE